MPYATPGDLQERLGDAVFGEIYSSPAAPEADLASASAEIDGAIATRYVLPVRGERSLALLRDWTLTLAEERAFARPAGSEFSEKVKSRVATVRGYLELVRAGSFRLPDAAELGASGASGSVALSRSETPVFTRDNMKGF